MTEQRFAITGMSCAACSARVEKAVNKLEGVKKAEVNLLTNSMKVEFDSPASIESIIKAVEKAGYGASMIGERAKPAEKKTDETKPLLYRLIASLIILIPLFYLAMGAMLNWNIGVLMDYPLLLGLLEMVMAFAIMAINHHYFVSGFKALIHRSPNMDTLVSLGSGVAFVYSFVLLIEMAYYVSPIGYQDPATYHTVMGIAMNLNFETAGTVVALITVGKTLESYSKGKTTSALSSLLSLAPKTAHQKYNGQIQDIPVEQIKAGDELVIYPGESFPADGKIIEGSSAVDESSLTGESMPIDKQVGDEVSTATINQTGALTIIATRTGEETTLSQIVKMVEEASSSKAPIARIADKVSGIFVPVVIIIALVVFSFWLIFGRDFVASNFESESLFTYALEKGIAVLVISCPCALGLATPVGIMVGSGKGAKQGILFKTATALEATGKAQIAVLDKTGTITKGEPKVTQIRTKLDENEFLSYAFALESSSEHPLAKAIRKIAIERNINTLEIKDFRSMPGQGVAGEINGETYYGGNLNLLKEINADSPQAQKDYEEISLSGATPLLFAKEGVYLGAIGAADEIKEDSKQAIADLKAMGIIPVMLTGDNPTVAAAVAHSVGIDHFVASLLPGGKLEAIRNLKEKGTVIMIGDGINDAPSLTEADIGMAIGSGSDIAIDSADVVITSSKLTDAVKAIRLSRKTLLNIKENLFWAFIYNLIMIPIAAGVFSALGMAKMRPWMGAAAMSLSSVTVVLNALRLNLISLDKGGRRKNHVQLSDDFYPTACPINIEEGKEVKEMEITLKVTGMMCMHCVAHVKEALAKVEGVTSVEVSLDDKQAVIKGNNLDKAKLIEAVKAAGYEAE